MALAPPHLEAHFKNQHSASGIKIDSTLLEDTILAWDLADSLPDLSADLGLYIEGLIIYSAGI